MARNVNQLFIKGDDKPWAEVITNQYGTMSVLVHDPEHYDEPMQIIIPSSKQADQLADAISHSAFQYQDAEELVPCETDKSTEEGK